jgi:sigma-E factor negative regulatory protein RseA
MNEQIREQLSALMDGELARDQIRFLLRRITPGDESSQCWQRYHLVRQAMRRQHVAMPQAGFAEAVMLRVDSVQLPQRGSGPWLRWGAGGAVAASVAMAALVLTRPVEDPALGQAAVAARTQPVAPIATTAAATLAASAVAPEFRPPLLVPNAPVETAPASFGSTAQPLGIDPELSPYLIRQYQINGTSGQSGFVPYVLLGTPEPVQQAAAGNR